MTIDGTNFATFGDAKCHIAHCPQWARKKNIARKGPKILAFLTFWHGGFATWHTLGISEGKAERGRRHRAADARRTATTEVAMYSWQKFYESGTAEQVARASFYTAALDAATAQRASRRADSRLLNAALVWAATCPELPPCPEELRAWGPDAPDALPLEPPSGSAGKAASAFFRTILNHLPNWPRSADGSPVGPESVTRRPSAATVEFLNGLDEAEADAIRALAAAAVRFGDRTRQKAASGSRKRKGTAESTDAGQGAEGATEGKGASGNRKGAAEGEQAEGRPDFTGMDPFQAAAAALVWAAEAAADAATKAEAAAAIDGVADRVKEAASFARKAAKLAAKAADLAKL